MTQSKKCMMGVFILIVGLIFTVTTLRRLNRSENASTTTVDSRPLKKRVEATQRSSQVDSDKKIDSIHSLISNLQHAPREKRAEIASSINTLIDTETLQWMIHRHSIVSLEDTSDLGYPEEYRVIEDLLSRISDLSLVEEMCHYLRGVSQDVNKRTDGIASALVTSLANNKNSAESANLIADLIFSSQSTDELLFLSKQLSRMDDTIISNVIIDRLMKNQNTPQDTVIEILRTLGPTIASSQEGLERLRKLPTLQNIDEITESLNRRWTK